MADQTSPLNAVANPYQAYDAMLNQQIAQLSQPRTSDLDPMAMLAIAQGLLSPTRTGSFGESMGNAAGAAIGPLSRARQTDQDRMDKIAKLRETQVRLALEKKRIEDLNTRAAAGYSSDPMLDYSRGMQGLEREMSIIGDPEALTLDVNTPEGKAERDRRLARRAEIEQQMGNLRTRYLGAGGGGGGGRSAAPAAGGAPAQAPAGNAPAAQPSGAAPASAGRAGRVASQDDLAAAQEAYKRGAPIAAIIKRFKDNGITGINPEDITGGK